MFLRSFFLLIVLVAMVFFSMPLGANAEIEVDDDIFYIIDDEKPYDHKMWERSGTFEQKVYEVGFKLLNANNFPRNVGFYVIRTKAQQPNAFARYLDGSILIRESYKYYIDSDDELASILAHEMAHINQQSKGFWPWKRLKMIIFPIYYEHDADLKGIDYMVKAGYNPLAMLSADNKIMGEFSAFYKAITFPLMTHPTASQRLTKMYNHILVNYPTFITEGYDNPYYANFLMNAEKDPNIKKIKDKHEL